MSVRNVLVGAVEGSLAALDALGARGAAPVAVVTLPLEKASRHSDWADLRAASQRWGADVLETSDVNDPALVEMLKALSPEYVFVIGWSQICRPDFLAVPTRGVVGYHPAPLPENRGRAVIPWTILQRRPDTGGTLFWMDEGMDSGDILVQEQFRLAPDETARTLYDKHLVVLGRMLAEAVDHLATGDPPRRAQDHDRATYCARRTPADGLIDWTAPAAAVWTLIRATGDPYPGAFTFHRGRKVVVWESEYRGAGPYWGLPGQVQALEDGGALVQCGDRNHVLLRTVAPEGGARCPAPEVLRRHDRLGIDWVRLARGAAPAPTPPAP